MGCLNSKPHENEGMRDRLLNEPVPTPSRPIGIERGRADEDEEARILGSSITDRRIKEQQQFLRNIMDTTTSNFINVGQSPFALEDAERSERAALYKSRLDTVRMDDGDLFTLPVVSKANARDFDKITSASLAPADLEMIRKWSGEVGSALTSSTIPNASSLVVAM